MSSKRKFVSRHPTRKPITEKAIAAFLKCEALAQQCECAPCDWEGEYWKHEACAACTEWWDHHRIVHHELGCLPHEWPCFEYPQAACPYPEGSFAADRWHADRAARPERFTLYETLKSVARHSLRKVTG
jgi:hypothetical protein